jgi:IS4 transposase
MKQEIKIVNIHKTESNDKKQNIINKIISELICNLNDMKNYKVVLKKI